MKVYDNIFEKIISLDNLFLAWDDFKSDKKQKRDVQEFEWKLEENIFQLHRDLKSKKYRHGPYTSFYLQDPKQRHIHKARVRDRVLHHAIFTVLNPIFEETFIAHSFSCRIGKGTHKGIYAISNFGRRVSRNGFEPCFALKCDIKKFFGSIDHGVLLKTVRERILDRDALWLIEEIVESFVSPHSNLFERKGLPIGNLTSQLFANIYLNSFDQFVKQKLRVKHYGRYTDDFAIISSSEDYLRNLLPRISSFLKDELLLELHPKKVSIRKYRQGFDFLGYVILPHHRVLRTRTRQRIVRKLKERIAEYRQGLISKESLEQSLQSYLGVLTHANTHNFTEHFKNQFWFWLNE